MQLLVTGGSGFIGRKVCKRAANRGFDVTSVSRSGQPDDREPWHADVDWIAADIFDPVDWRSYLDECDAIVHSVGILDETPPESTFERVNGDAGILVGLEAERAGPSRFVHLSAGVQPPFVRSGYLDAKRRTERALTGLDIELTVLRLGPVYGSDQPHFPASVNRLFSLTDSVDPLADRLGNSRPLPVEAVARAALAAVEDDLGGTVTVPELSTYRP